MFLERWKFKYELKINHAKLCIKIDNIQNIFGNDPKHCCCVELKQDRRTSGLTSPGLEIDITLALPLPRLLSHYQLRLRAILYTVLSNQRASRGQLLLGVQRGQTHLGMAEVRGSWPMLKLTFTLRSDLAFVTLYLTLSIFLVKAFFSVVSTSWKLISRISLSYN